MKIRAKDGRTYEVAEAAPGASHKVSHDGAEVGSFVLEAERTRLSVKAKPMTEALLREIADEFVERGGAPMGMI